MNRSPALAPGTSRRLPPVVALLALGVFVMSTTEFLVAGILPEMAADFDVSLAGAGLMITVFAVGMVIGAPVMAALTLRLPQRTTLVAALVVFALGHVVVAFTDVFSVALVARAVTALATGTFWSVAAVVASAAAGPAASTRALGVMMSGVGLATVVGVPLGSFAGQVIGWRAAFWALAAIAVVVAVVVAIAAPAPDDERAEASLRDELRVLERGSTWWLVAVTALITGGYMAAFSYVAPLLTDRAGLPAWSVPLVLVGYGTGSLFGANVGGGAGGRRPTRTLLRAAVGIAVILGLLVVVGSVAVPTIVLVVLLGFVGMTVPPVATGLAVRIAPDAPTLAAAFAVAAFNAGIALASWAGGRALETPLGLNGPLVVGVVSALLGVVALAVFTRVTRRSAARTDSDEARPVEPAPSTVD